MYGKLYGAGPFIRYFTLGVEQRHKIAIVTEKVQFLKRPRTSFLDGFD